MRWTISIGQIKWKYSDQSHFPKVVPKTKAGWDHLAGNRSRGAPKSIIRARPCDDLWCLPARADWLIVGDCGGKGVSQRWSCHPESASASTSGCQDPSFRLVPFHVCFQVHQKSSYDRRWVIIAQGGSIMIVCQNLHLGGFAQMVVYIWLICIRFAFLYLFPYFSLHNQIFAWVFWLII